MSTEVLSQLQVNFFVCQLGEIQSSFEAFHFKHTELVFQCLVSAKLNCFQFHFSCFPFGTYRYGFRSGQARMEITDAVQMNLASFRQFLSHDVRKRIKYGCDVCFCQ